MYITTLSLLFVLQPVVEAIIKNLDRCSHVLSSALATDSENIGNCVKTSAGLTCMAHVAVIKCSRQCC